MQPTKRVTVERLRARLEDLDARIREIGQAAPRFEGGFDDIRHVAVDLEDQLEAGRRLVESLEVATGAERTRIAGRAAEALDDLDRDLIAAVARHGTTANEPHHM